MIKMTSNITNNLRFLKLLKLIKIKNYANTWIKNYLSTKYYKLKFLKINVKK